jgi:hypothetical protein
LHPPFFPLGHGAGAGAQTVEKIVRNFVSVSGIMIFGERISLSNDQHCFLLKEIFPLLDAGLLKIFLSPKFFTSLNLTSPET